MLKVLITIVLFTVCVFGQTKLVPEKITLKSGKTFSLNLPANYEIIPAAEGMKRIRFFAKAPDGRIFVTDMHDLTDNEIGKVYILDEWDEPSGKFGKVLTYMSGLKNPNSVAFYTDAKKQDWMYLAETDKLTRRRFTKGETKPTEKAETLATFPDYGLSYKYGGWHLTRTIAIGSNGKIYVSVGSSCNACIEKEKVRATVLEMNPNGTKQRVFAKGLRNAVGLKWIGKTLFATNQGSDHLGLDKPDETFYALKSGTDYGWAFCHQANGKIIEDPEIKRARGCKNIPRSYTFFPARSSALGFDYFDAKTSDPLIKNSFLVSLHGSSDKDMAKGYKIVIARKGQNNNDFITGFLKGDSVFGRPCDIFKLSPDSFLFSDDKGGVVYYVRKKS
jgi:glucose/arabinose dehydrogenase